MELSADHNRVSGAIVDSAFAVHQSLGPGLLESVYEQCLALELRSRGLIVAQQVSQPVAYRGVKIDAGFRLDLVVEDLVVVEVKAAERLLPVHDAQLLTYLKLSGRQLGLLINFNVPRIKEGIKRLVRSA
jgi:GxxExxY protein